MFFYFFLGETSSGKSSIINAILGEKILPTGVTATTTRVCRVKHSEKMMIITLDVNYKILEKKTFSNIQEMAADLKTLAQTNNPAIGYVDILTPVLPFQQVQYVKKSDLNTSVCVIYASQITTDKYILFLILHMYDY